MPRYLHDRYITLWIAISATVILYNKYLLSHVFPYPITLTMYAWLLHHNYSASPCSTPPQRTQVAYGILQRSRTHIGAP